MGMKPSRASYPCLFFLLLYSIPNQMMTKLIGVLILTVALSIETQAQGRHSSHYSHSGYRSHGRSTGTSASTPRKYGSSRSLGSYSSLHSAGGSGTTKPKTSGYGYGYGYNSSSLNKSSSKDGADKYESRRESSHIKHSKARNEEASAAATGPQPPKPKAPKPNPNGPASPTFLHLPGK